MRVDSKKMTNRSKCADCKIRRNVQDENSEHDTYLKQLSRVELFVPSKTLARIHVSCLVILYIVEKDVSALSS